VFAAWLPPVALPLAPTADAAAERFASAIGNRCSSLHRSEAEKAIGVNGRKNRDRELAWQLGSPRLPCANNRAAVCR
jgi:hypothetical protein